MNTMVVAGGVCFIVGALAFVAVFSYLAARFDYPQVLDGEADVVLPRLRGGGAPMRAVWAIYSLLPLLLIPAAVGASVALPGSPAAMTLARIFASLGALSMCLGLMRWPSIHWALAQSYETAGAEARHGIGAVFRGLNLYLGNYIGEFLGEVCLGAFFLISGYALFADAGFPPWVGLCGMGFGALFIVGAFRNVTGRLQFVADANNYLLPLWMIVLGVMLMRMNGR